MEIVMISGRAGVGKTTFANYCRDYILKNSYNATIIGFAVGIKRVARSLGWDSKKDYRGRKFLQQIGSIGREYNENAWVKQTINEIVDRQLRFKENYNFGMSYPPDKLIFFIDDWRFPNEENVLKKTFKDVITVRVYRPEEFHLLRGTSMYDDVSETSLLDNDPYDFRVYNDRGLKDLQLLAKSFCDKIV